MNKIGLHVIGTSFDPARLGKSRLVKLVNPSVDYVQKVRAQVGDTCLVIVRFWHGQQPLDEPERRAQEWWDAHAISILAMRAPNLGFESYNEIGYDSESALLYARFELERMRILHAARANAIILNCGVAQFTWSTWPIYQPVLDAMGPDDKVGLHEYWNNRAGMFNRDDQGRFTWAGRFSSVRELAGKPKVITEAGRDAVGPGGQAGWQRTCNAEEYLGDLAAYNAFLEQYPNVVGACIFQAGAVDPQWAPFDVAGIWDRVVTQYTPMPQPQAGPPYRLGPLFRQWLWPVTTHHGEMIDPFGTGMAYPHIGTDFGTPLDTEILAPFDGIIDATGWRNDRGYYVWLLQQPFTGADLLCCHLRKPGVKSGDRIQRGQVFALSGNTGQSTGPHLHARLASVRNDPPAYTVFADHDLEGPEVLNLEV